MESIWPPNRVTVDQNPNDRTCAHIVFFFLLLLFSLASGWTIYDAITTETWSSKTTKEAFDFPIITICGDDVGRKHTIISHNCLLYDYLHHDEDDEDYHEKPTCESFEASNLDENIINPDEVTGPCVVYNSNKALRTDIDGYYEMVVQFNAILSDSEELLEVVMICIQCLLRTTREHIFYSYPMMTCLEKTQQAGGRAFQFQKQERSLTV